MNEPPEALEDQVCRMPTYAKQNTYDEKDRPDSCNHAGEDVDHHRNAARGKSKRKDTGITEPVSKVAGERKEPKRPIIPEDADDGNHSTGPRNCGDER